MNQQMTETRTVNGVDVGQLMEHIEAIKANPVLSKFRFKMNNEWYDGGHNRGTINGYHGVGEDFTRDKSFTLDADEPPVLLGMDKGPNPVEYLLAAITACVTTATVYHAAARGIRIDELESSVDGDIDIQGFLGLNKDVRPGYQEIRMNFRIKSDAPQAELDELLAIAPTLSPVFNSVTQGVPVRVNFERKS